MQKYQENLAANDGGTLRPLSGASVAVADQATGLSAALYSDNGVTPLAQPLTTDASGNLAFYAADGKYTLTFSSPRFETFAREVILEDPADNPFATLAQLSAAQGSALIRHDGQPLDMVLADLLNGGDGISSVNSVTPQAGNVSITTDNIPEPGAPTNQWFTAARVRGVVLTGLSLATNAAASASDTVLQAIGKLQAQVNTKDATGGFPGMTGFAINLKNAAGTIVSKLASAATVARTWTFPDKDGTVAMLSDMALTKYVETADQVITDGGGLTIAHGLAVQPKIILGFLRCLNASAGYQVGDVLPFTIAGAAFSVDEYPSTTVTSNSTNLFVRFSQGTTLWLVDKTSGSNSGVSPSNFRFFIRAFA